MTKAGHATPEEAELAFYDAFETSNLSAMMSVWADSESIECIHPMSDRIQGRDAVENSWQQIFSSGLHVKIRRSDIHRTQDALLAVHVLYEHLSIPGRSESAALSVYRVRHRVLQYLRASDIISD
jgi:ketosteroid isomerase-like protein